MDWTLVILPCFFVVGLIIKYALPHYVTKIIDNRFNKKLENHKHDLNQLTEDAKFDYQRMLSGFNLYAPKRHDAYARLHSSFTKAKNYIFGLRGAKTQPAFTDYDASDIQEYLTKVIILPNGKVNEIVNLWNANKHEDAKKEIRRYLKIKEYRDADNCLTDVYQSFFDSSLYLSNDANAVSLVLLSSLRSLLINYNIEYQGMDLQKENEELKTEVTRYIDDLTSIMKRELSVGYFKE